MAILVEGGQVLLPGQAQKLASPVEQIDFPDAVRVAGLVPNGANGTVTLKRLGSGDRYDVGDDLDYSDGNHNNDAVLHIQSVVGPLKYKIQKTA